MRPVRAAGIIKDRMTVIGPLVTGKSTLDLGVVDSRRQRHQTDQRLEKTPSSLFRQIHIINPEAMGVDIDAVGVDLGVKDLLDIYIGQVFGIKQSGTVNVFYLWLGSGLVLVVYLGQRRTHRRQYAKAYQRHRGETRHNALLQFVVM